MDLGLLVALSMVRARSSHSLRNLHDNIDGLASLWDNPDFIQAGFHVGRFITAVVESKAD
jgi:hypothetical protein